MEIKELCQESHRIAREHGFWEAQQEPLGFPTKAMLIITEVVEAVEAHRAGQIHGAEGVILELADIWLRLADLTAGLLESNNYSIDQFVHDLRCKMAYNEARPRKHGKRY